MPRLTVEHLTKSFDDGQTTAVDDISFEVEDDEIVALLGPSGCGKTTTLRCMAGVETPDTGRITIGDQLVFDHRNRVNLNPEHRHVGMIYQNYAIWPHKSVYQNVVFPLKYKSTKVDSDEEEARVEEILQLLEIGDLKDKPATDLSGGQQQRVALARSIVHDPSLLLLDEPLSNLDKKLRTDMRDELQRIQARVGISMLYVTHDQDEAFYLADRVLIMDSGDIVEVGKPSDLRISPESKFTREFLGDWNKLTGTISRGNLKTTAFGELNREFLPEEFSRFDGDVTCFLHPSTIGLTENGAGPPEGYTEIEGEIVAEGVVEDHYEVSVNCNDELVKVYLDEFRDYPRGQRVKLHVDPKQLRGYQ